MAATDTFQRPADVTSRTDPAALYVRSYLNLRTGVGILGIALPIVFIIGEAAFLRGGVHFRGSISGYYHSSMHDVFVAGLSVIGFLLLMYMTAQPRTWDYWLSTIAGATLVGVAFFPTMRPGLKDGAPLCGVEPEPAGCFPIQQALGERVVAVVHFASAAIFISCLAAIAFLFAYREKKYEGDRRMEVVQKICGWAIIVAVVFVIIGALTRISLGELTPLYIGEVVAIWAFGISWLLKGRNLKGLLFPPPAPAPMEKEPAPRIV
jgi:hypothetical protein